MRRKSRSELTSMSIRERSASGILVGCVSLAFALSMQTHHPTMRDTRTKSCISASGAKNGEYIEARPERRRHFTTLVLSMDGGDGGGDRGRKTGRCRPVKRTGRRILGNVCPCPVMSLPVPDVGAAGRQAPASKMHASGRSGCIETGYMGSSEIWPGSGDSGFGDNGSFWVVTYMGKLDWYILVKDNLCISV